VDGREKFGTYFRDAIGQDYADQRYYNAGMGRFWSPDPGGIRTAHASNPASWNRYSYVNGDPVNMSDPSGLDGVCGPYGTWMGEGCYNYGGMSGDISSGEQSYLTSVRSAPGWGWVSGDDPVAILQAAAQNFGPPDPNCVQDAISAAAAGVGLSLSSFTNISVQIVGTQDPSGGTYGETELNLSGGDVQGLINAMCAAGFYSNGKCDSNNTPLVGAPHTAPDGTPFTGNFRSPSLTNSVQVNTNVQTGQVQIDVDPYNPAAYPILGAILHGVLQVLPNKLTGGDNTYGCGH
jgi:RHS repeat-associated protein